MRRVKCFFSQKEVQNRLKAIGRQIANKTKNRDEVISPALERIFAASAKTKVKNIKVVILG